MKLSYLIVAAAAVFAGPASAQFHTWVGGSGSNWSSPANWDPVSLPISSSGTALTFPRASTNNDLPGAFSVQNLFIDAATGGSMVFSGNPIRFAADVSVLTNIFSPTLLTPLTVRFNNQIEVAGNLLISRNTDVRYEFNRPFLAGSNVISIENGSSVSIFAANSSAGTFELLDGSPLIVGAGSSTFINPPNLRFFDGVYRSAGGLPKIQNIQLSGNTNIAAKAVFEPILFGTSVELIGNISLSGNSAELSGPFTLGTGPHGIIGDVPGRFLSITSPVDGPGSFIVSSTNLTFSDNAAGTAKHTYTGVTSLFGPSSLTVTHSSVLSPSTAMFLDIPASLDVSGTTQKIGDILALGSVNISNATLDVGSATMPPGSQMTGPVTATSGRLIKSGTRDFRFAPSTLTATADSLVLQVDSGRLITTLPQGVGILEIAPNATATIEVAGSQQYTGLIKGTPAGSGNLEKTGPGLLILRPEITEPIQIANLTILAGQVATTDNSLIINYATTSPISTLISYILSGTLIPSSDFASLPTYLAIAESSDLGLTSFNGIAIDSTTVLLKYTYVGDANLDGQVDALDYERIDLAIGNTEVLGTAQGDLNYDGNVDALDYEQVDLNIGNGVGSPLASGPAAVFIPEPSLPISAAIVATVACIRRRRRL
jgi:hypothetical protein